MAEMYQNAHTYSSSSINPPPETDDISLFLRQILLRSSTTTASPSSPANKGKQTQRFPPPTESAGLSISDRIHGTGALFAASNANVSSSSVGTIDNDFDDYDCESEEGFENLMEEMAARPNPPRNPSKRSRAAEVHNLSEKRRRSRINEKMKALQKLIPNSNKTDKASMLDEAIEYLKQLQLQVQMLTMRNGLNLYSMSVPGVLPPNLLPNMTMGLNEGHGCLNINTTTTLPMHKEVLSNPMFSSLPIQCTNPGQTSVSNLPHMINPESSSQFESSFQTRHGQFQFLKPTDEFCREEMLSCPQMDLDHTGTNSLACLEVRLEGVKPSSAVCKQALSPHLDRTRTRDKANKWALD